MEDTLVNIGNIGIFITYGLVGIAVLLVVGFSILFLIQNFKKARGALLGVFVLAAIVLLSYFLSSAEPYEAHNVGSTVSQWVGAGITSTMILIVLGLVAAVFTEIYKLIR